MNKQKTYLTISKWLDSCITPEQIDLCVNAAEIFLLERLDAEKEFLIIKEAAEVKRKLPEHRIAALVYDNGR